MVEESRGGQGVCARVKHCGKHLGSYPIELLLSSLLPVSVFCSPLCPEAFVSFACSCGKGIADQHLKGIMTGRTGAALLNLQRISNS